MRTRGRGSKTRKFADAINGNSPGSDLVSDVINAIIQSGVPFKCAFGGDETVAGRGRPRAAAAAAAGEKCH